MVCVSHSTEEVASNLPSRVKTVGRNAEEVRFGGRGTQGSSAMYTLSSLTHHWESLKRAHRSPA